MPTNSSFTAGATSDVPEQLERALRAAIGELPESRAERISTLQAKIRELEQRGFLKRQQYSAPSTGEFERRFASLNRKG